MLKATIAFLAESVEIPRGARILVGNGEGGLFGSQFTQADLKKLVEGELTAEQIGVDGNQGATDTADFFEDETLLYCGKYDADQANLPISVFVWAREGIGDEKPTFFAFTSEDLPDLVGRDALDMVVCDVCCCILEQDAVMVDDGWVCGETCRDKLREPPPASRDDVSRIEGQSADLSPRGEAMMFTVLAAMLLAALLGVGLFATN